MNIFITALNLTLFFSVSWWIWRNDNSVIHKLYWPSLFLKLTAGLLLGVIYSKYYTDSDTFFFFNEAVENANRLKSGVSNYFNYLFTTSEGYYLGESRMRFFVKVVSVFCLLTNNNYWITSLYFSFLSFLSAWWLVKIIVKYLPGSAAPAAIAFLFFPSCVFWSSGIMKESFAMTAIFFLTGVFLLFWFKVKIRIIQVISAAFLIWIGWNLKYYYFGLFIPVLFSAWVANYMREKFKLSKRAGVFLLFFALVIALISASFVHPNFSVNQIAEVIIFNNRIIMEASAPEDVIHFNNLDAAWPSLAMNAPLALLSGLFRPFIWEASNFMQVLASIENLTLLLLTILLIRNRAVILRSEHQLLIISVLVYCVLLCIFLAISSPNFGTLVRYRVGFLPFYVLLILHQPFISKYLSRLLQ